MIMLFRGGYAGGCQQARWRAWHQCTGSIISITQNFEHGLRWRVNYGPKDYIGRRGGDLIVEVDATDMTIQQVLYGQ